jgi:hypothetical protein
VSEEMKDCPRQLELDKKIPPGFRPVVKRRIHEG